MDIKRKVNIKIYGRGIEINTKLLGSKYSQLYKNPSTSYMIFVGGPYEISMF